MFELECHLCVVVFLLIGAHGMIAFPLCRNHVKQLFPVSFLFYFLVCEISFHCSVMHTAKRCLLHANGTLSLRTAVSYVLIPNYFAETEKLKKVCLKSSSAFILLFFCQYHSFIRAYVLMNTYYILE